MSERDAVIAEANRRYPSSGSIHDTSGRDRDAFIEGATFALGEKPTVDRDDLLDVLDDTINSFDHCDCGNFVVKARELAAAVLTSGILLNRAEAEAQALERAADSMAVEFGEPNLPSHRLRVRAADIREGS